MACLCTYGHVRTASPVGSKQSLMIYRRSVCMTLGRPSTLRAADDVPIPSVLDDGNMSLDDTSSLPDGAVGTFFFQNSRAARLLGRILDQIYHPSSSTHPKVGSQPTQLLRPETLSTILNFHSELEDFESSNPITLCVNENGVSRPNSVLQRQQNVLHSRSGPTTLWKDFRLMSMQNSSHEGAIAPSLLHQFLRACSIAD
jgi:hypothetical protein